MTKRTFQIYRYDPDTDAKPRMQTLEVELDGSERMLLDALMKLKALDPSLSFRRSCREGVCGSDAMNINGKNGLACLTNMRTLPGVVVLKPLPGLPVIRDLIVDMTQFFKRAQRLVRVHPVRLVLDLVPQLLVEPGQVRRPGRPAAGLPIHRRQPRPGHRRAPGRPRRPVPPVPLPHDHELRGRLPEGTQPDEGDRQDQGNAGSARRLR
jgi:2Fe-2S iron-sulfur cluster binding domain